MLNMCVDPLGNDQPLYDRKIEDFEQILLPHPELDAEIPAISGLNASTICNRITVDSDSYSCFSWYLVDSPYILKVHGLTPHLPTTLMVMIIKDNYYSLKLFLVTEKNNSLTARSDWFKIIIISKKD